MTAILFFLLLLASVAAVDRDGDGREADALLLFKASLTNVSALSSWSLENGTPCSWDGITCDAGITSSLRLAGLGLSGTIDVGALERLPGLRSISLDGNSFSGPIPPFSRLEALKSIYLSGNSFSGAIPSDFFSSASHLKKLWLSNNNFEGAIPPSLAKAVSLIELHLEGNHFAGAIPDLQIAALASFNVSKNQLSGAIPSSFRKFNANSFAGNAGLCGPPLDNGCVGTAAASGVSTDAAFPGKPGAVIGLVLVLLVMAVGAVVFTMKRRRETRFETLGVEHMTDKIEDGERENINAGRKERVKQSPDEGGGGSTRKGKRMGSSVKGRGGGGGAELIMVNESKGVFDLPDLMKAAADVIGTGAMGSVYKATLGNGMVVAVKRMREMNRVGKETFEVEMRRLGRVNHPNVLPPLAYHYRKDEKLLISEYVHKGSLLYLLHGDRGTDHKALNWPTRLKIIRGIASGMAYLHAELNSVDVPHGNLKSGNVLLGHDFEPLLVDYGFLTLINPSHASQTMFAYKSPEFFLRRWHVCPKSDVYCLGIIVLELLSGKFPSLYLNNTEGGTDLVNWTNSVIAENLPGCVLDPAITNGFKAEVMEMERMVRVGAELVQTDVDRRPDMKEAARMIEEVAMAVERKRKDGGGAAASHEALVRDGQTGTGEMGDGGGAWRTGSITERTRSITERTRSMGDNVIFAIS